jgi:hypothetical protein
MRELGAHRLVESWNELTEACVVAGCDLEDGALQDASSSDEVDEEWCLDVANELDENDHDTEEDGTASTDDEVVEDLDSRSGDGAGLSSFNERHLRSSTD